MSKSLYLLGDADRVRESVDRLLLRGKLPELTEFSERLSGGVARLVQAIVVEMEGKLIMAGGDDVLFTVGSSRFSRPALVAICARFQKDTGCVISFGIADSLDSAYLNLRRAKADQSGICAEGLSV